MQLDDDGGQANSRSRKGRRDQASEPVLCPVITLGRPMARLVQFASYIRSAVMVVPRIACSQELAGAQHSSS